MKQHSNTHKTKTNIMYLLIDNQWVETSIQSFIQKYNVNKRSLDNALYSKQGWGRVRLPNKDVVVVSKTAITIKPIEEQVKDFANWWVTYKPIFLDKFIKRNPKIRIDDLEDICSDAMVYVIEQLMLGTGVNNYVHLMLLKANGLLLDKLRLKNYVNVTYYEINEDPQRPEEYYNVISSRQQLECCDIYDLDEDCNDEVSITDNREYSIFDNTLTLEESIISQANDDMKFRVIRYFIMSSGCSEFEYNVWFQYTILTNSAKTKQPLTRVYNSVKNDLNGVTLNQYRKLVQRIDKLIKCNLDEIRELYDTFKYRSRSSSNPVQWFCFDW